MTAEQNTVQEQKLLEERKIFSALMIQKAGLEEEEFNSYRDIDILSKGDEVSRKRASSLYNDYVENHHVFSLYHILDSHYSKEKLPRPKWLDLEYFLKPNEENVKILEEALKKVAVYSKVQTSSDDTTFYEVVFKTGETRGLSETKFRHTDFHVFMITVMAMVNLHFLPTLTTSSNTISRLCAACSLFESFQEYQEFLKANEEKSEEQVDVPDYNEISWLPIDIHNGVARGGADGHFAITIKASDVTTDEVGVTIVDPDDEYTISLEFPNATVHFRYPDKAANLWKQNPLGEKANDKWVAYIEEMVRLLEV